MSIPQRVELLQRLGMDPGQFVEGRITAAEWQFTFDTQRVVYKVSVDQWEDAMLSSKRTRWKKTGAIPRPPAVPRMEGKILKAVQNCHEMLVQIDAKMDRCG